MFVCELDSVLTFTFSAFSNERIYIHLITSVLFYNRVKFIAIENLICYKSLKKLTEITPEFSKFLFYSVENTLSMDLIFCSFSSSVCAVDMNSTSYYDGGMTMHSSFITTFI